LFCSVYLRADPEVCYRRIKLRDRKEEAGVPFVSLYNDYFKNMGNVSLSLIVTFQLLCHLCDDWVICLQQAQTLELQCTTTYSATD